MTSHHYILIIASFLCLNLKNNCPSERLLDCGVEGFGDVQGKTLRFGWILEANSLIWMFPFLLYLLFKIPFWPDSHLQYRSPVDVRAVSSRTVEFVRFRNISYIMWIERLEFASLLLDYEKSRSYRWTVCYFILLCYLVLYFAVLWCCVVLGWCDLMLCYVILSYFVMLKTIYIAGTNLLWVNAVGKILRLRFPLQRKEVLTYRWWTMNKETLYFSR